MPPKSRKRLANHDSRSDNPDSSSHMNGNPDAHPKNQINVSERPNKINETIEAWILA